MIGRLPLGIALAAGALLAVAGCGSSPKGPPDLVFVSSRDGDYAIYSMNADGSREQRLTRDEEGDASTPQGRFFQVEPAWSPDGRRIAFASKRSGNFDLYVMRVDGTGTRRLTSTPADETQPTWSPDGTRIAFARGSPGDVYVMAADGTRVRRVTNDAADEIQPAWSPDGRWIAYSRRTPGTSTRELWRVRPDGSQRRRVTSFRAISTSPTWSADGTRIAFVGAAPKGTTSSIYIVKADGTGLQRLTLALDENDIDPAWAPDGTTIAFSRGGSIVTITGGRPRVLTDASNNDSSPSWRPGSAPGSTPQ